MGPVRRVMSQSMSRPDPGETGWVGGRLAGVGLLLVPQSAYASVCETLRPDWQGGSISIWLEFAYLFASFPSLVLVMVSAYVVRVKSQWGGLVTIVAWTIWVSFIISAGNESRALARAEGCIGSPALFIGLVAAICVVIVLTTLPRPGSGQPNGDK